MIDPNLLTIVTGAAGSVVASMATGTAVAVRAKLAAAVHRGSPTDQRQVLAALDSDAAELARRTQAAAAEPARLPELQQFQAELHQQWTERLASFLSDHPGSAADLQALEAAGSAVNLGTQTNSGSGTFINGPVTGGIHNSYSGRTE